MYAVYNRREKENKMLDAIRKRNVTIRKKIKNESVSISIEVPAEFYEFSERIYYTRFLTC